MKKKHILIKIIAVCMVFLFACSQNKENGSTVGSGTDQQAGGDLLGEVQKKGVLTVGTMGTYQPYTFLNKEGELDGFDVDIAKEIAKGLNVDIDFVSQEFSGMIAGLQTGKFDMVASQMTITDERKQQMLFSDPYITNEVKVIVQDSNTDIASIDDFVGKKIGVGLGTNDETYLRTTILPEVGDFTIRTYDDVITSLRDLDAGRIDATINNLYALKPIIEANGFKIKAVGDPIKSDRPGLAVKKGNEAFIEEVNRVLKEIKQDGTYDKIFVKWFGEEPPAE